MTKKSHPAAGCGFIIRGWPETEKDTGRPQWRFRVRNLLNGDQYGLVGLEALLIFLRREFGGEDMGEKVKEE